MAEHTIDRGLKHDGGIGAAPAGDTAHAAYSGAADARVGFLSRLALGEVDRASIRAALGGAAIYLALAIVSLLIARTGEAGGAISPVWLPNAAAAAFLLRARLANELLFLIATFIASLASGLVAPVPVHVSLVFSIANVVEIAAVVILTRETLHTRPDMRNLSDLARFVWAGAVVGPMLSALLTAPVMGSTLSAIRTGVTTFFLTDSMAMVLIVPAALLLYDRAWQQGAASGARLAESAVLLAGGMACAFLVFNQPLYPLMFLIPPITLLHAFRLGSLGSALLVGGVAVVAGVMTHAGIGPIAAASPLRMTQLHLLQAFVAANFLTGLPVAAILAGRDRMVEALAAGKRQLDLLADNITDAILRYDLDGVCTYASPSVRDVLGRPPEVYIGHTAAERLHPEAQGLAMQALRRLVGGESDKERFTYRRYQDRADGTPVFLEADCAVVRNPDTGEREGVVVAARDVTERVELEALLTRARRNAENAARAKSEFLANMSHEIRTPMNGVLGFAELMLQGDLSPDHRRHAEMIVASGRSMMMLLNDVLDLSKIESGQFTFHPAPVDLAASLAECASLYRHGAEQKGLAFHLREDAGAGERQGARPWIVTDGLRLRQIVLNLVGNAVKFTEQGSITITFSIADDRVRISVADTGIGIKLDRLETIFHPFTQGENDTARRFGGTGLGLSISRQLATLLGGEITMESTPGKGSCVTLTLPAVLAPAPAPQPPSDEGKAEPLPAASRILLVEDHDINRMLVTEMLERCGQEVAEAHDGNEAIAMVIDSLLRGRPYDLVLMDIQMPDCDGYAATRAIRGEGIGPDVLPIVALTANAFPEDIAAARAAGMQAHLAKPVVFAELARALQRWLPTRIVEADPVALPAQPRHAAIRSARRSSALLARWQTRRAEAVEAVRAALTGPGIGRRATDGAPWSASEADELASLMHKLAGTAAMFGEDELGACAARLETSLRDGSPAPHCRAIAEQLLALAERQPETASMERGESGS